MSPIDSGEYRPHIGLRDLYIAQVVDDTLLGYAAEAPQYLAPAAEASAEHTINSETLYYDDGPYEVFSSEGETAITVQVSKLPSEIYALITGQVFDAATGRVFETSDVPEYFALSFRSLKSNGSYEYFQYLKGRFDKPNEALVTKGETPEAQNQELTYRAIKTTYLFDVGGVDDKAVKGVRGDEDTANFSGTTWFDAVQTPEGAAPSSI